MPSMESVTGTLMASKPESLSASCIGWPYVPVFFSSWRDDYRSLRSFQRRFCLHDRGCGHSTFRAPVEGRKQTLTTSPPDTELQRELGAKRGPGAAPACPGEQLQPPEELRRFSGNVSTDKVFKVKISVLEVMGFLCLLKILLSLFFSLPVFNNKKLKKK